MVREYLEKDVKDPVIEKLDSKGKFASFKVGYPWSMLDKVGDVNYWPPGVHVKRFRLRRPRTLATKQTEQTEETPEIFLR